MSVERVERQGGTVWRVRWREGTKARSRVIGTKRDAVAFDAEIRRRLRLGEVIETHRRTTLGEVKDSWWRRHVKPNLAERTRRSYGYLYDKYLVELENETSLTLDRIEQWMEERRAEGVGEASITRCLMILSSILTYGVNRGLVKDNPIPKVKKPSRRRQRAVRPLSESEIDRIIDGLEYVRDQSLVLLMAYAGLRPSEALALTWEDIGERRIIVDKAMDVDGKVKTTKNAKHRTIPIEEEIRYLAYSHDDPTKAVIGTSDGQHWDTHDWKNWLARTWRPLMKDLGLEGVRPYDLRHTYASRLIHEGLSVVEVARRMGHDPAVTLSTYAHVFEEAKDEGHAD